MSRRKSGSPRTDVVFNVATWVTFGGTVPSSATSNRDHLEFQVLPEPSMNISSSRRLIAKIILRQYVDDTMPSFLLVPHPIRTMASSQSIPIPQSSADSLGRTRQASECVSTSNILQAPVILLLLS